MWNIFGRKSKRNSAQDVENLILVSQIELNESALMAAEAARELTTVLRGKLDDYVIKFEKTTKLIKDAIFICKMDGKLEYANPAAKSLFNLKNISNINILNILEHNNNKFATTAELWNMLQPELDIIVDLDGKTFNNDKFPVCVTAEHLIWFNNSSGMLLLVRDASPINKEFNCHMDALILVKNDIIIGVNPSIEKILGHKPNDIIYHSINTIIPNLDFSTINENKTYSANCVKFDGTVEEFVFSIGSILFEEDVLKIIDISPKY